MNTAPKILSDVHLASYTTLQIGGPAEFFCEVVSIDEFSAAVDFAREQNLPIKILGGGSNVLVSDAGVQGLVIKNSIGGVTYEDRDNTNVVVAAGGGVVWDDLVASTVARGLWGIENLSAIPGTVGATPVQNVGAYGVEVSELIEKVTVYNLRTGVLEELNNRECGFGYRDSFFKTEAGSDFVVMSVSYLLTKTANARLEYKDLAVRFSGKNPTQQEIRDAVIDIRSKKFPDWRHVGTAGSFFKNPIIPNAQYEQLRAKFDTLPGFPVGEEMTKIPLGWILDNICNLRGYRIGNIGTYDRQALVVVNYGGATATEVAAFADDIARNVKEQTGITVDWEVTPFT